MGTEPERVVVGVDGSPDSEEALTWALRYALTNDAEVTALVAWAPPDYHDPQAPKVDRGGEENATRQLTRAVTDALSRFGSDLEVDRRVARGSATRSLLEASADADLLVLGSRGHGGFPGALLGSVAQHCVHHAACPVVVVREPVE
ncbi:universal stress protein [Actinopolyspora mortivallis]|uniref:Universal stress protein UspA n=1 Tax=Actinopolyspora mortivallis TaxID=33906 RepID=A0A2T0GY18_ACTMO|nr:universal stress protein [Actinopolyspora mortivallis]PRW64001.1 universal stress protein UspA [Actinopolyspora mortivallis]